MDIAYLNLAFVETSDVAAVEKAIPLINQSRRHAVGYNRIILTTPRRGWLGVLISTVTPDHYLLRNISGRLNGRGFSIGINNLALYYRFFENGHALAAYESHLALSITQQLRTLIATGDILRLDLAEPSARLVLQRYHEYQRAKSWFQPSANEKIPRDVAQHYAGNVKALKSLLVPGTNVNYVQEALQPGFSAEVVLDRLVSVLSLPYLPGDQVEVFNDSEDKRTVAGYAIWQPDTWENEALPEGWSILRRELWQSG